MCSELRNKRTKIKTVLPNIGVGAQGGSVSLVGDILSKHLGMGVRRHMHLPRYRILVSGSAQMVELATSLSRTGSLRAEVTGRG